MSRDRIRRMLRETAPSALLRPSTFRIRAILVSLLLAAGLFGHPPGALADPQYEGVLLYGFDPVIRATEDPRLLGVERLVLLRRLETWNIRPTVEPEARPDLYRAIRARFRVRSGVDLVRENHLVEYNGPLGLMTEIRYPKFFFLFPTPEPLPGGFTFYPPRPLSDPVVRVFVDDLESGARRRFTAARTYTRITTLDVAGQGRRTDQDGGLINLTIPIKLPRTLEKIIGRGEKTRIKITGRERIAITGESTVLNPFTPSERVTSQSLFPSLDMEQELQINLSGVIGEKIIIEVDHNSAGIGPDATKIKLMYQGDEDEVIRTIETGDVGLTLPGSQLLGYNSNKSGLFGIKVTGQVGRADFTVVASKQKAESSAKTFNAQGGQVSEKSIFSSDYLNNQFFQLDLPLEEIGGGRTGTEVIDLASIRIYQKMGPGTPTIDDITNVAAYVDSTGWRNWDTNIDFTQPFDYGTRWRRIADYTTLLDGDENLVAINLGRDMGSETILAVTYDILDAKGGTKIGRVGDNAETSGQSQPIQDAPDNLYYRMKLLKATAAVPVDHVFKYILRNIYSLGGSNIDPSTFDLRIEENNQANDHPEKDERNIDYIRIFGLDNENRQGDEGADGVVDYNNSFLFDLNNGLLKFPLDFPTPFAAEDDEYAANVNDPSWVEPDSFLANSKTPQIYDKDVQPTEYFNYQKFKIVTTSSSSSSTFNLGVSNIQEDSEVVLVDGATKTRGVDYEIDYVFGELTLKGETANALTADSKVAVSYQYSPFFGGGDTSLMGLNVGYDLGRESKLGTTWLYQSESIVGEKPKLGEEPNRTIVGNLNLQHTMRPDFLTSVANLLSRQNTERESSLQFSGESAISLPNPNTKGTVYLEDFEGVDSSDIISLTRIAWFWASQPFPGQNDPDARLFLPEKRVESVRWFLPKDRVLRRYLNPDLINQERDETQPAMNMFLRAEDGVWDQDEWGGIMRGISRTGLDLSKSQFVEIWINDGQPDIDLRRGKLHIDFGYINEDGFWPVDADGNLTTGRYEKEDVNEDGIFTALDEDVGLDGNENGPQRYQADFDINGDTPYPRINGTARNNREDDEDLNGNTNLDRDDGYYTTSIDLKDTKALVDVVYDYDDVDDLVAEGISWRKYRIKMGELDSYSGGTMPNLKAVTHARIWYEDPEPNAPQQVEIQLSEFRFLGSRWERDGVRRTDGEILLPPEDLPVGEEFFLGEVNNKENPDYYPPFAVNEVNNIPEKEQSLVLNFSNIQQGHMTRASKQVSSAGDDYTGYGNITWYYFNPNHINTDLDLFFRVGADTLNYYEVLYSFRDNPAKEGWKAISINLAELSNVKNAELDADGNPAGIVNDLRSGDPYQVRVVGRPDLRRVRRYYFGIMNNTLSQPASGYFYLNDVILEGVKRDVGMANRAGVRLNMADVIKLDFDWRNQDAEYHGLNARTGSGVNVTDWNLAGSLNVDDFIPLAGFRLPISLSRRKLVSKPKYEINSDIEILDPTVQDDLASTDQQERFSSRLSHSPSKAALLRYLVDPFTFLVSGSRRNVDSPLERRREKNLTSSLNYDLRIAGTYRLNRYPIVKHIPVVKAISVVPTKIAFGAGVNSLDNQTVSIDQDGEETPRPLVKNRPMKITASVDWKPLPIMDTNIGMGSNRDLLRTHEWNGINIGEENNRSYDLRLTLIVPKARSLGEGKLLGPFRTMLRGINKTRPSLSFQGSFADNHDPGIRQADDPDVVRNVSNSGRWELRLDLPIGDGFKSIFPAKTYSAEDQTRMIADQRRREQQAMRGRGPGTGGPQENEDEPEYPPEMTPEERQQAEAERLLREAEEQEERDRELGLTQEAPADTTESGGRRVDPFALVRWIPNTLRNSTPLKVTATDQKGSSFTRLYDTADFWYRTGLSQSLDVSDDLYASFGFDRRKSLNLATTSQISRNMSLDLKYGQSESEREQISSVTRSTKQDWPEAQFSLSGLEKWRIFGANPDDRDSGWFQSSNLNLNFKRSKTVNNITATSYNPHYTWTTGPRWTMAFHSGLTATLNATISKDDTRSNGTQTLNTRSRYSIQVRKQFNAQSFLAKIGLYRPGSSQSVNMDVDLSYQKDRTQRINPGGDPSAPTGLNRLSLNPRFSYQITRNLSGAVRFIFSRSENVATSVTTTTLGLGVEATFVF